MGQPIVQVDAFTGVPFAGNPAAVCVLSEPRDDHWMAQIASEMNLAETAFLLGREDGYDLRWFTPAVEVDLCGHATLASAHVLWEEGHLPPSAQARFHTRSGLLTATRLAPESQTAEDRTAASRPDEARGSWIELDFPAVREEACPPPPGLAAALGVTPCYVGRNVHDYLAEVASEAELRAIRPDFAALRALGLRGVIVTSRSASTDFDFVSRFFAPGAGIDEDPVTGSAHCCLGPYWRAKLGKDELVGYQASARGGVVRVRVAGERVLLRGQAVTVLRGELV